MAIKKGAGGLEDLTMGMSTVEQLRNGQPVQITQINAGNIPYSATQSITQKMNNFDGQQEAVYVVLDEHIANEQNPHKIVAEAIGAAPIVHTHVVADVNGLQTALDDKAFKVHEHVISDVTGLQTALDDKSDIGVSFLKTEHVVVPNGAVDAGKPIVLNNVGAIDPTLLGTGLYPVGMFTPTSAVEYPDTTGEAIGAFWGIEGVDDAVGYTFVGGDLAGVTLLNGDAMIFGTQAWGYLRIDILGSDYYRLDGTIALSADLAGGGYVAANFGPATKNGDLVEFSQVNSLITQFIAVDGTVSMTANLPLGGNRVVGVADAVDLTDGVNKQQLDAVNTVVTTHVADVANPHAITKAQVGLGSADNTADLDKPVSTATQALMSTYSLEVDDLDDKYITGDVAGETAVVAGGMAWNMVRVMDMATISGYLDISFPSVELPTDSTVRVDYDLIQHATDLGLFTSIASKANGAGNVELSESGSDNPMYGVAVYTSPASPLTFNIVDNNNYPDSTAADTLDIYFSIVINVGGY